MARSYFARYWAVGDTWLIGGIKHGSTSRFGNKEDAETRLQQTIEMNGGETQCMGEIVASERFPEIFAHCPGSIPQGIGGLCFSCKKLLTVEDAKGHKES